MTFSLDCIIVAREITIKCVLHVQLMNRCLSITVSSL